MKKTVAFFLILLSANISISCNSQSSSPFAPEAGDYTGNGTTVGVGHQFGYNYGTGFGVKVVPTTQSVPAPMGDLIITQTGANKGSYRFRNFKEWTGAWQYDAAANRLSFSGYLKDALNYYHAGKGFYTIQFRVGKTPEQNQKVIYSYYTYSRKASKPFPKPVSPNGTITGTFTTMPDFSSVVLFDAATGKTKTSFSGKMAASNKNGTTVTVAFTDDPHNYAITVFDTKGDAKKFSSPTIVGWNLQFLDYVLGVLADDNKTVALMGRTPNVYDRLNFIPGENVIALVDLATGEKKGMLPTETNQFVKPCFLSDGRLVYCPKGGGIAISDAGYKKTKTVYGNTVNALAVSPDGKRLAISEGVNFYTMNLDGTNKQPVICSGEALTVTKGSELTDLCWSPDGKYLALNYGPASSYNIVIVPLDGGAYRFLNDDDGEPLKQQNSLISWN